MQEPDVPAADSRVVGLRSVPAVVSKMARGKKVIAFDVFDTLLRRRIEPETIKDLVARELTRRLSDDGTAIDWTLIRHKRRLLEVDLGCANEARGHDHEFRLAEMAARWVDESRRGEANPDLVAAIVRREIELEKTATLPNPGIAETLAVLKRNGRRLIFITDTYLDLNDVWGLLKHHALAALFDDGYCSSTDFKTKRAGTLYRHVLRSENLRPSELLFVGDNPHSDVRVPRGLGIDTVQVRDDREHKRRARLQLLERLSRKNPYWIGSLGRETIESVTTCIKDNPSPHYRLGLTLSPAFIAFTLHVIEQARELSIDRFFFLSREGFTFLRMYRRIIRRLGIRDVMPEAVYLAVSRAATFLPSMERLDQAELDRMWHQYDRQSMNQLLRNLSLPPEEFLPLAARCGFADMDAPIEDPASHRPFGAFLADPEVQRRFRFHRDRARDLLRTYLAQKSFLGIGNAGVVDIGWKGSIQDNLVRAVGGAPGFPCVHGLYFGLTGVGPDNHPRSHKHGFMADSRRDDYIENVIFKNGPVFEMFSSAPHGAVTGYRAASAAGGRVKPLVRLTESERRNLRTHFATVFQGVEDYFRQYLEVAPLIPAAAEEMRPSVLDQLRRYILYPTAAEAKAFVDYSHVENFGVHQVSTYEFQGSWRHILLGGSPLGIPRRLRETLRQQFWPEAILKRTRIPLLNFLFDLLETRSASRL